MRTLALVLAGGKSSRMKTDKASLEIQGTTLLNLQLEKALQLLPLQNIFISGDRKTTNSILDLEQGLGPLEGVRSALVHFQNHSVDCDEILVFPVDMPLLSTQALRRLLEFRNYEEAVFFLGYNLPIKLRKTKRLLNILENLRRSGRGYSFQNLIQNLKTSWIHPENVMDLINTNTREEWNVAVSKANRSQRYG